MVRGWLLDLYPSSLGEMTLWIISEAGQRFKLIDNFQPKIYVAGREEDLQKLTRRFAGSKSVAAWRFAEKYVDLSDEAKSKVLEIYCKDHGKTPHLAQEILELGGYDRFRLGNVDLPDAQAYLYDREIFPLAFMEIGMEENKLTYSLLDSVESEDYVAPPLRIAQIDVKVAKSGKIPAFDDPIHKIELKIDGDEAFIDEGNEREKILTLVMAIKEKDPDIIFTHGGDSTLFPYLSRRALINGVADRLILGRERAQLNAQRKLGKTFFSYGRVYFKSPMRRLHGRIHIDVDNTFIYRDCGLEGLIEIARTCRVPLHRAARASIGTIMSSLQLYQAVKDDIMIPWKKSVPETFKSAWELLIADRGGFIFEPKVGLHDWVGEIDFASMYPTLMATRNISAETVLCGCCPNSSLRVPDLGYNICERRLGIVPKTLKLILKKRADYKRLRNGAKDQKLREDYDRRQSALKWILVTSFGYLGYKNAKFGKVDAHIAVCAFARDALLRTAHLAEERGFEVVHGIVDSLWLKKDGAKGQEFDELCKDVSEEIGVPISFEGRYRWIVFLPSRVHEGIPVLNRYYGVFEDGKVKVRGIDARRRDTPKFIRDAQIDAIKVLGKANSSRDFVASLPGALKVLKDYAGRLVEDEVALEELFVTKQLSMNPGEYVHDVFQAIAATQLLNEGVEVSAGQNVRYLITDAGNARSNRRVMAAALVDEETRYDADKYLELLISAGANILGPFGYTFEELYRRVVQNQKQTMLS
ncbi:MAG TPA: DNA polymerase domain-containing protein [Candidatus Bathyarchaeia archaeon]|nr:DNA polymerase domain-containing protein [Candidatus Bathyarchaeia archaeon]